jgi:type II secretory pathway component GspD/PulD (secretin)
MMNEREIVMRRRSFALLPVLALAALLGAPATGGEELAAQQQPRQQGSVFNFQDAELAYVLQTLAQTAGINLYYADLPQKPVTLRTMQPVSTEDVRGLIRSIAEAHGITVVQGNGFMRLHGTPQAAAEDPRQLYIQRLSHARAPVLAATLQALFGGGSVTPRAAAGQTLTQQLQQMQVQAQQAMAAAQRPQQVVVSGPGGVSVVGPYGVLIVPDDVTNSLLVRATPADWQVIQQAIRSLDLRPLQVVIEVVIAEVRHTDDLNLGLAIGATDTRTRPGDSTTGLLPGVDRDDAFTLRVVRRGNIDVDATLSALAASGRVRVLSRPVILAQNNQEAQIVVGEERPFIQVSRSLPTSEPVRDQVVQYRNVATSLNILPTINDDGYVNLAVTQEVNTATSEIQFGAPVISTRTATTQILARDGQTVVIGGLIDRQTDRVRSGVPFLKDIPLLGYLFGSTRETVGNAELFLFLTPHIVATDEDADRMKDEIERNVDLLAPLTPVRPIIPPANRHIPPGTIPPGTVPPDTIPPGTIPPGAAPPDTIPPDTVPPDTLPAALPRARR